MSEVQENLREKRIVLDNQDDAVTRHDGTAVIRDFDVLVILDGRELARKQHGPRNPRYRQPRPLVYLLRRGGDSLVRSWEVQREGASFAGNAGYPNLPAKKPRNFPAD